MSGDSSAKSRLSVHLPSQSQGPKGPKGLPEVQMASYVSLEALY